MNELILADWPLPAPADYAEEDFEPQCRYCDGPTVEDDLTMCREPCAACFDAFECEDDPSLEDPAGEDPLFEDDWEPH
jgi:hypothetical protein